MTTPVYKPTIKFWSCPLSFEVLYGPVKILQGMYVDQGDGTGAILLPDNTWLTVFEDGTYGGSATIGQWQKFTVMKPNLLRVVSGENVTLDIPYHGFK